MKQSQNEFKDEYCPQCGEPGYQDALMCLDCGYRRAVSIRRITKEERAEMNQKKLDREALIEKIRLGFKSDPRSSNWTGNRMRNIAEIAVVFPDIKTADDWLTCGPKLEYVK